MRERAAVRTRWHVYFRAANNSKFRIVRNRAQRSKRQGVDIGGVAQSYLKDCERNAWEKVAEEVGCIKDDLKAIFSDVTSPTAEQNARSLRRLESGVEEIIADQANHPVSRMPWETHQDCAECLSVANDEL
jgi:hypothetical protein